MSLGPGRLALFASPTLAAASCGASRRHPAGRTTSGTAVRHLPPATTTIGHRQELVWCPTARHHGLPKALGVFSQRVEKYNVIQPQARQEKAPDVPKAEKVDYTSGDEGGVLSLPLTQELTAQQLRRVFGYSKKITNSYEIGEVIGAGSFGVVRTAADKVTGQTYAVKSVPKVPKKGKPTPRYLLKIQTEVEAMLQVGASLNAVFLKDVFEDRHFVHMVMELCTGGALMERFENNVAGNGSGAYDDEQEVARQVRSVLRFLAQCHAKGIIYRDVKPDNFLFLDSSSGSPLKATDFGLAIRHWPQEGNLKSRSGTPAYMAPEVIMQNYNEKCDIWSAGMLMYQLLTGQFPFWPNIKTRSLQEVWKSILVDRLELNKPELRSQISRPALDLLKKLLVRDPVQRLTAAEALEHPWIKELDTHPDMALSGSVMQRLQRFATYGRLKQTVLSKVAAEIIARGRHKSLDELHSIFKSIDSDQSGDLSLQELSSGLRLQGYNVTDDEVLQLMSRVDMNSDGLLNFSELVTALLDWDALHREEVFGTSVDAVFSKLDASKRGYLVPSDLFTMLPKSLSDAKPEVREREARRMMREIDTTHDGHLSKPEFVAILMDSYGDDNLQQYDDRLYHDPDYNFSVSLEDFWNHSRDGDGEVSNGSYAVDGR